MYTRMIYGPLVGIMYRMTGKLKRSLNIYKQC